MSSLITIILMAGLNLYFLKDSPNLLVRIKPEVSSEQVILYYSFAKEKWDSVNAQSYNAHFDAVVVPPETVSVVGLYFKHDDQIDNNNGALYLFEVKKLPKMIIPLTLSYLETVLKQARKKIISQTHIDEGITIIDYVDKVLKVLPYIKGSEHEIKINLIQSEVNELKALVAK